MNYTAKTNVHCCLSASVSPNLSSPPSSAGRFACGSSLSPANRSLCVVELSSSAYNGIHERSRRGPPPSGARAPECEARGREKSEGLELDAPLHLQNNG